MLNNVKEDNRAENLSWVTWLSNRQRATKDGLIVKGSDRANAKLTERTVCCIYILGLEGKFSHQQIADFFGVSRNVVTRVLSGKIWKHVYEKKEHVMGVIIFHPLRITYPNTGN
jgi:DNA invertase Pin-like site-specific DNA recombinase